ncbi:hypothetical protein [Taklimakanibacter deserti]|uniref:hypothetical protein n=1 Tax=Taklimakanibacter deserti TaxID=2267839 RepID=UPI0013C4ADAC
MGSHDHLNVTVAYPAAEKPFHDHHASLTETLAALKARVLAFFSIQEGSSDGNQITYRLYKGKDPLNDLTVTLGSIAGHAQALSLKLAQQIEQGQ